MCGIAGVLALKGAGPSPDLLQRMIGRIGYRGPDAFGHWGDGPVRLAHARLSIIDLSGGSQPMSNADGSLWITFNGEIYNFLENRQELAAQVYIFRSRSDTEVRLHLYAAYGQEMVHK